MKQVINILTAIFLAAQAFSQSGSNNNIPELVFQNPVLVSGVAAQNDAVYKFSNIATGIDATVKIKGRSSSSVKLISIDVSNMGWTKAFQPHLGIAGNVPANQDWWMDFEMTFYRAGTSELKKIDGFQVTAIDIDGDGVSIREYLQMNRVKSVEYCQVNYLTPVTPVSIINETNMYNNEGVNQKALGPVQNFYNIDTAGTPVMATYTYENKDKISFRYGAKSGSVISNAGERLNSLWFKRFELTAPMTLPVNFASFNAYYDKKHVLLDWTIDADNVAGAFSVQRSTDGTSFTEIGTVKSSASITSFQFRDDNVSSSTGIVYYRIASQGKTGELSYSYLKLVRLTKETGAALTIYPNPVQNNANLTLPNSWQNKPVTVNIYNGAGVQLRAISIKAASQTEALDFHQFPGGIYVVKAQCEGQWAEQRIVKN